MQILPAIDLKNNSCVRLSKGEDTSSIVFNNNPTDQAIYFQDIGCKKLHIVDLDSAFGRPEVNLSSIKKIRKAISIPIQLGGGIRTKNDVKKYFDLGIDNLIIGSMSVKQREEVKDLSSTFRNKIYVSLDIRNDSVMIKGWKEKTDLSIEDLISFYDNTFIRGYIVTDIENDGMLRGLNTVFLKKITDKINNTNSNNKKIVLAGGLTNYDDLRNLKLLNILNIEGIISGKSFYVGNIDLKKAQKILSSNG